MNRFDQLTPAQEEALRVHERKLRAQSYPHVRLKDGRFICDKADASDTEWIVHADSAVAGWVRWEGKKPVEVQMASILDAPLRRPNTFTDQTKWKVGTYGIEDPWKRQHELPLENFERGALTLFIADNMVTRKLIDGVLADFIKTHRRPVIRLLLVDKNPSFEIFDHVEDDTLVFDLVRDNTVDMGAADATENNANSGNGVGGTTKRDLDDDVPF